MVGVINIVEYENRFWHTADIYKNNALICEVNFCHKISEDNNWIFIYNGAGGHDNIRHGDLIEKIYIGDCELKIEKI